MDPAGAHLETLGEIVISRFPSIFTGPNCTFANVAEQAENDFVNRRSSVQSRLLAPAFRPTNLSGHGHHHARTISSFQHVALVVAKKRAAIPDVWTDAPLRTKIEVQFPALELFSVLTHEWFTAFSPDFS
jgi:hypothetical protein